MQNLQQNIKLAFVALIIISISTAVSFVFQPEQITTEQVKLEFTWAFQLIDDNFVDMWEELSQTNIAVSYLTEESKKNFEKVNNIDKRLKSLWTKVYGENADIRARMDKLEKENVKLKAQISDF